MPNTSIVFGSLLVLIGIVGYGYGLMNGNASLTALIPAAFGIMLALLGFVSNAVESLRKHMMHVAVAIALIGFMLPMARILMKAADFTLNAATISQLSMAAVCLFFVTLAIRSFANAKRDAGP